jgi:hypothetical protein
MRNRNPAFTAGVIAEAARHVGYRSQPERKSAFQLKPYLGKPWNGTFVDRVLHDAFGDFAEVRFVSTVAALGYYVKQNRVYQKPQPGDIVFFNFSTDPQQPFEQPHVGIVSEVGRDGSFRTIEGETAPGTPQGSQLADGVFERVRFLTDTVGFVRPKPRKVNKDDTIPQTVKMSYFDSNGKTVARAIEAVQVALNRLRPSVQFNRGKRDARFKSAFGAYARETGTVENRGEIKASVLDTLSDETGVFTVE